MPHFSTKTSCWAALWIALLILSVIVSLIPVNDFVLGECEITSTPFESQSGDDDTCLVKVNVTVSLQESDQPFNAEAQIEKRWVYRSVKYYRCEDGDELNGKFKEGTKHECWVDQKVNTVHFFSEGTVTAHWYARIAKKGVKIMAGFFGLCAVVCAIRICRPNCETTLWPRLARRLWRRSSSSSGQEDTTRTNSELRRTVHTPYEYTLTTRIARPRLERSWERISALVDNAKVSDTEARQMVASGWSCCICLDSEPEDGCLQAVTRLECHHATHSECLRSWLLKGRAVCCLCNADVFPKDENRRSLSGDSDSGSEARSANSEPEDVEGISSSRSTPARIERPESPLTAILRQPRDND